MSLSNINRLFFALAIIWTIIIFWLSSSPDAQGLGGLAILDFLPYKDKFVHAGIFGLLAILLRLANFKMWQALLISSAYGISDEFHQYFIEGRASDIFDWLADTSGAIVALGLMNFFTIGNIANKKR